MTIKSKTLKINPDLYHANRNNLTTLPILVNKKTFSNAISEHEVITRARRIPISKLNDFGYLYEKRNISFLSYNFKRRIMMTISLNFMREGVEVFSLGSLRGTSYNHTILDEADVLDYHNFYLPLHITRTLRTKHSGTGLKIKKYFFDEYDLLVRYNMFNIMKPNKGLQI